MPKRYKFFEAENDSAEVTTYYNILNLSDVSEAQNLDIILRIKEDVEVAGRYNIAVHTTENVIKPIQNLLFENSVLRHAFRNQWREHKYNQEYVQYLLGLYTKEEFLSLAKQFARTFNRIDTSNLTLASAIILDTLGESIDSGDLSQILNVDPTDIELALSSTSLAKRYDEDE